jgi:hypothetical protein
VTEHAGRGPASRRRYWLYLAAALAALVLGAVVYLVVLSQSVDGQGAGPTPSPSPSAISSTAAKAESLARFTGSGDKTTTAFSADSNWEITWKAKPQSGFTVELLDKDGTSRGQIVTGKNKTKGSTFVSEAGEFTLRVTSSSPWLIAIVGRESSK